MRESITRRTLLATAAATVLATAVVPFAMSCADTLARVDVYDRSAGETLPVYRQHGRRYVEGQPGNEYAVRIRNCTDQRLLAVLSVDGVNAVTGETASPDQSGYVIEPGGYVTVQGWRKDLEPDRGLLLLRPGSLVRRPHWTTARPGRDRRGAVSRAADRTPGMVQRRSLVGVASVAREGRGRRCRAKRRTTALQARQRHRPPHSSHRSVPDTGAGSTRPSSRSNSNAPARDRTNWSRSATSVARPWSRWVSCRRGGMGGGIPIRSRAR